MSDNYIPPETDALISGWVDAGIGMAVFILSALSLGYHLWAVRRTARDRITIESRPGSTPPGLFKPVSPIGGVSRYSRSPGRFSSKSVVSLMIKVLIPFSVFFRAISILYSTYYLQTLHANCLVPISQQQALRQSCFSELFLFNILFSIPNFVLSTLLAIMALFWRWFYSFARNRSSDFAPVLYEWGIFSGLIWVVFFALFAWLCTATADHPLYIVVQIVSTFIVVIFLVAFSYYGYRLIMRLRSFGLRGKTFVTRLFVTTSAILVFYLIRLLLRIVADLYIDIPSHTSPWFFLAFDVIAEWIPCTILLALVSSVRYRPRLSFRSSRKFTPSHLDETDSDYEDIPYMTHLFDDGSLSNSEYFSSTGPLTFIADSSQGVQ
ncbi:MAG: hypothetical protein Q8P67_24115 [archaeon]|nr:hypothetical protein [archaeon]